MCRSLVGLIFNGAIAAPKREVADFQIHTLFERLLLYPSRDGIDIVKKLPVREKKFESYDDLQERVGFKEPVKHISERIMDEITGQSRMNLFVKR